MPIDEAIRTAAKLKLTITFDENEVSERGGFGVPYSETGGDIIAAFAKLVECASET